MNTSPYIKDYQHIDKIDEFFQYIPETKEMIFIGETLEIRIPKIFEARDMLEITDTVKSLAVCDLIINEQYQAGLYMLAVIEILPSEISQMMIGDDLYVVLTLNNGDTFMKSTELVKNKNIIYAVFTTMITQGNVPYYFKYADLFKLFDQSLEMCDSAIPVDHVIFEMVYSHLYRDSNNLRTQYRFTDGTSKGQMIPLRSIGFATTSTTAKLLGSYYSDGLNSALCNPNTVRQPIEDILR